MSLRIMNVTGAFNNSIFSPCAEGRGWKRGWGSTFSLFFSLLHSSRDYTGNSYNYDCSPRKRINTLFVRTRFAQIPWIYEQQWLWTVDVYCSPWMETVHSRTNAKQKVTKLWKVKWRSLEANLALQLIWLITSCSPALSGIRSLAWNSSWINELVLLCNSSITSGGTKSCDNQMKRMRSGLEDPVLYPRSCCDTSYSISMGHENMSNVLEWLSPTF